MRYILVLGVFMALAMPSARAETARSLMKKGRAAYSAGDYTTAATNFAAAAAAAESAQLDPAVAKLNQAAATYKAGQAAEAADLYAEALTSSDLVLQHRANYDRGNALMSKAQGLEQMQKLEDATKTVGEALQMYENAMALDARDQDPKVNFELALLKQAELQEKLRQQQQQQDSQDNKDQKNEDNKEEKTKQDGEQKQDDQPQEQSKESAQDKEDQQQEQADPANPEEMTQEEAALLLDAARQQEQADREQIRLIMGQPVPVEKDW